MSGTLFFVSDKNYMKRDPSSGFQAMAAPATPIGSGYYVTNLVVTHNLGYLPVYQLGYEALQNGEIFPAIGARGGGPPIDGTTNNYPALLAWPTTTTLTIQLFFGSNTLTGTYNVYWVIYQVAAL